MIQIIGFGEVVLLEEGMSSKKEMRVRTPDGKEHGVPVPEDVVKSLLSIWVSSQGQPRKAASPVLVRPKARVEAPVPPAEPDPEPDVGEVTFGGNTEDAETPDEVIPARPAVPKFASDDDDGPQI